MNLQEATQKILIEGKLIEANQDEEFKAFFDKWHKKLDLQLDKDYKWENNHIYEKFNIGWQLAKDIKIMRNIDKFKIGAMRFECALPYSKYFIVDTQLGDVYVIHESIIIDGWNGTLNRLTTDLKQVCDGTFIESNKPKVYDFDPSEGL